MVASSARVSACPTPNSSEPSKPVISPASATLATAPANQSLSVTSENVGVAYGVAYALIGKLSKEQTLPRSYFPDVPYSSSNSWAIPLLTDCTASAQSTHSPPAYSTLSPRLTTPLAYDFHDWPSSLLK